MSYRFFAPALLTALLPVSVHAQMSGMGQTPDMAMTPTSGWSVMAHTTLTVVADDQQGPRGDAKTFVEGISMIMASRALNASNDLELQAMLSPDPFMGKSGYPLLLQTGETADGVMPLIDRQHPHDLFMGLNATLRHRFGDGISGFVSAGWPGDNGFGPEVFMHRPSGENFPTAPITHHWFDSGHITMGVVTAGFAKGPLQLEVSGFTGREPDQNRFNLDRPRFDSVAVRLSWRIAPDLSAQASWAHVISPEQLEPDVNLIQKSVSFAYNHAFAAGTLDSTLAFGRKIASTGADKPSDAVLLENTFRFNGPWLGLLRHERVYNDELVPGSAGWVAKTEIGVVREFDIGHDMKLGVGVVRQFNAVPDALKTIYGGHPDGTVAILRLTQQWMPGMSMSAMDM